LAERAILSWSGGKDSSLSLYEVQRNGTYRVVSLLTTLTRDFDRISMHGVRRSLLALQATKLNLPLEEVWIGRGASNEEYEAQMSRALSKQRSDGVRHVIFGDLFLEDIRKYREDRLAAVNMTGVFPIWHRDTKDVARFFVHSGFRAIVCTVDPRALDPSFCGREFDDSFLSDLPPKVDPCGENGEFHTFVYAGPIFEGEIGVRRGEVVERDGFCFADMVPA